MGQIETKCKHNDYREKEEERLTENFPKEEEQARVAEKVRLKKC